jgi:hypothetical protein
MGPKSIEYLVLNYIHQAYNSSTTQPAPLCRRGFEQIGFQTGLIQIVAVAVSDPQPFASQNNTFQPNTL